MNPNPKDPQLFELFCGAIECALGYVRLAETKNYIGSYDNWPELKPPYNGMPHISRFGTGPRNYAGVINELFGMRAGESAANWLKEPQLIALVEYAKVHPRLKEYFHYEERPDVIRIRLVEVVADILDRYVHANKIYALDRDKLTPIYLPIETFILNKVLPFTAVVPILCLKFEPQNFRIDEGIWVEELSDEFQLSRGWRPCGPSDNSDLEDAATHGLFISDCSIENVSYLNQVGVMELDSYPVQLIDTFFAAIRIATGYDTGNAQILALPVGWASSYVANLTPILGPNVEHYPPFFKQGYWLHSDLPNVTSDDSTKIGHTFQKLQKALATLHSRRIRLAIQRLNLSSLRTTEEDGVLDAMIAMEALLSDDSKEMTHKVAMRLGGLYKIADRSRSRQAFKELKRIYEFRSKIVHGAANLDPNRELTRDGEKIRTIDAAIDHLRAALGVLIENPILLDPTKIDDFLLTDTLEA